MRGRMKRKHFYRGSEIFLFFFFPFRIAYLLGEMVGHSRVAWSLGLYIFFFLFFFTSDGWVWVRDVMAWVWVSTWLFMKG